MKGWASVRLPDFLIIGAQKAGTTSLYRDLLTNPAVFMPADKEPGALCHDEVLTPAGRERYAKLFENAKAGQICGEASTDYTKAPQYAGVPERALEVLGPETRLIYLVRNPIKRMMSQHHHMWNNRKVGPDIDVEIRKNPIFIDWSSFGAQARRWLEAFPRDRLRIIRFEDYVRSRETTVADLCPWLGIEHTPGAIREDVVHNRSVDKPMLRGPLATLTSTSLYRRGLRPLLPMGLKDRLRASLLPKAEPPARPPSEETVRWAIDRLRPDLEILGALMGRSGPVWSDAELLSPIMKNHQSSEGDVRGSAGAGPAMSSDEGPDANPSARAQDIGTHVA